MSLELCPSQKQACSGRTNAALSSLLSEQLLTVVASGVGDAQSLLETIGDLLSSQDPSDTAGVAQRFPQVGQALTILAQRRINQDSYSIFLDNVRWFQSKSEAPAQVALASQSQHLIRGLVVFPQEWIDDSLFAFVGILGTVPLPTLILALQRRLAKYLTSHRANDEQLAPLCTLATKICNSRGDGSAVLAAAGLLETLIRHCPTVVAAGCDCPEFAGAFYETVEKAIEQNKGSFAPSLLEQLAKRYPVFLERQVVNLFGCWVRDGDSFLTDSWLVSFIGGSPKLFQDICCVLHSLLVKLDYNNEARAFIKDIVAQIKLKTSVFQIYPVTLASILVLLEVEPRGLPLCLVEAHAITTMSKLLGGLTGQTFDVFDVAILACHYSEWWSHIQSLSQHKDRKIRIKYRLLENIVFGTSLMAPLRKSTFQRDHL